MKILGISAHYHDSAAAIIAEGGIVAAAQEERFTRRKHDAGFPSNAIQFCLDELGVSVTELDAIVYYDKPLLKFERLLETYLSYAPFGIRSFVQAMPVWLKEKLYMKPTMKKELAELCECSLKELPPLLFSEHHLSHAASAFYPSPFSEAGVLCMDGVGEWSTTSVWKGNGESLELQWDIKFPHSLGLLYSAFTYYTGFKVNSGEYKLMGLAPYGEPRYVNEILEEIVDIKDDGTFRLNMKYFDFATGLKMTNDRFAKLFGGAARDPESEITQKEMDIARSIQYVVEEAVLKLGKTIHDELGVDNLCLAGGVALNCVANGRLLREGPFKNIWIQPAAGDAGGAIGAALAFHYSKSSSCRKIVVPDAMKGAYLGPRYEQKEVEDALRKQSANFEVFDEDSLIARVAGKIEEGCVIGWFQGRMEFGPRALGARSIIGDPRSSEMQSKMNLKIKYRESFRPFAPSILADKSADWFDLEVPSPYMLLVAPVVCEKRREMKEAERALFGVDKLNVVRSEVPAITHVDYSARIQTVHEETNPRYFKLLKKLEELNHCPMVINTSFNVRGEPIVCSVEDAYRCFMRTEMDILVVENCVLEKAAQPSFSDDKNWKNEFVLD
jgi:carbamoyltransferase